MGYNLEAIIAAQAVLGPHAVDYLSAHLVPLPQGFSLLPLTVELADEIGGGPARGDFFQLTPALVDWLIRISSSGAVAYLEADFFGGTGEQHALVRKDDVKAEEEFHGVNAINQALHILGVKRGLHRDEFEAIDLPRHRNTSDWLEDAAPSIPRSI